MNIHGKDIKIFTANSNPRVAKDIAKLLGLPVGKSTVTSFADGEISVSIEESVRGSDVFVIQSTCAPVNNNLMELLIMVDAFKRASAGRITAVIPYYGYARQDRKAKARDPISAKLCADLIATAGADRVLTMDLHAPQIQGFFNIPVDHLLGVPILAPYYAEMFKDSPREDLVVVSPDLGSVTRARKFAERMNASLAIVDKRRQRANVCEVMNVIGDVKGKKAFLVDDMVDTAGSICNAAAALMERVLLRFMPVLPTACFPALLWNVLKTAASKKCCFWIPSLCRRVQPKAASSSCPLPPYLPRPLAASTRTSLFLLCLFDKPAICFIADYLTQPLTRFDRFCGTKVLYCNQLFGQGGGFPLSCPIGVDKAETRLPTRVFLVESHGKEVKK